MSFLPQLPLPAKIRTALQPPVEVDADPDLVNGEHYVEAKYRAVRDSIQRGMDVLARRRAFPLFG